MIGTLISDRMIPPLSRLTPTGAPVTFMMSGPRTIIPMNPQTTDGIGGQQLDDDLQRFLHLARTELGNEDGRPQTEWDGDHHGDDGHRQRTDRQRQNAVLRPDFRRRPPVGTGEKLTQIQRIVAASEHGAKRTHVCPRRESFPCHRSGSLLPVSSVPTTCPSAPARPRNSSARGSGSQGVHDVASGRLPGRVANDQFLGLAIVRQA